MNSLETPCSLEVLGIRKEYPGVLALDDVSLSFRAGEVHALIGKNGAGKSTLVKIISGAVQPSAGTVSMDRGAIQFRSPADAIRNGISTVYQELSLVPEMTVAENILLGRTPTCWRGIRIDWSRTFSIAREILDSVGVRIDARRKIAELGMADRQMVEIAKAMVTEPRVLLLDEPTSALAHSETKSLFRLIQRLTQRGVAVIYISHRLQELPEIADRVSVLRDGRLVGTNTIGDATPTRIAAMMFGSEVRKTSFSVPPQAKSAALEVKGFSRRGLFEDVSFRLHTGEVLGIAGMVGSGRTELLRAISGADRADEGVIIVGDTVVSTPTPFLMKRLGVGLTPENRKDEGLVLARSTHENICLASLNRWATGGVIRRRLQRQVVRETSESLAIEAGDPSRPVGVLSGGNQQKVVIGKWLNAEPRALLLDEPTRGIDVHAKQQVFQIIRELSQKGIASVFVSSELEELLDVCHRILVMRRGRIVAEVNAADVTLERLFGLCLGASQQEAM